MTGFNIMLIGLIANILIRKPWPKGLNLVALLFNIIVIILLYNSYNIIVLV